ncbi:hypothetical protein X801_06811 [Opisthorchis viverrini]|uniref:Protein kinase domain-containing protein n=1 Tax=Opisthorchis viverrini TaxID=6198 RepID=A0A1S8WS89_OPIVI|nr:hypothetical protein X801_06811 [Opisthorchis viverrini]
MSFAGTVAWMAPEVIRNEPCSLKVDVWSYGVILWELLTGEIPYNGVDSSAIIWGVGSGKLRLLVPASCPTELRILINMCWNNKPRSRPSFRQILSHLEFACNDLLQYSRAEFLAAQQLWKEEIALQLEDIRIEGNNNHTKPEVLLLRRRREELRHAQDLRRHYDDKLERVNDLCTELQMLMREVEEQRCLAIKEREHYEELCRKMNMQLELQFAQLSLPPVQSDFQYLTSVRLEHHKQAVPSVPRCLNSSGSLSLNALDQLDSVSNMTPATPSVPMSQFSLSMNASDFKTRCPVCGAIRNPWGARPVMPNFKSGWKAISALARGIFTTKRGVRSNHPLKTYPSRETLNLQIPSQNYCDFVSTSNKGGRNREEPSDAFSTFNTNDRSTVKNSQASFPRGQLNKMDGSPVDRRYTYSPRSSHTTSSSGISSGIILSPNRNLPFKTKSSESPSLQKRPTETGVRKPILQPIPQSVDSNPAFTENHRTIEPAQQTGVPPVLSNDCCLPSYQQLAGCAAATRHIVPPNSSSPSILHKRKRQSQDSLLDSVRSLARSSISNSPGSFHAVYHRTRALSEGGSALNTSDTDDATCTQLSQSVNSELSRLTVVPHCPALNQGPQSDTLNPIVLDSPSVSVYPATATVTAQPVESCSFDVDQPCPRSPANETPSLSSSTVCPRTFPLLGQVSPLWPRERSSRKPHVYATSPSASEVVSAASPPRPVISFSGPIPTGRPDRLSLQPVGVSNSNHDPRPSEEASLSKVVMRAQPGRRRHIQEKNPLVEELLSSESDATNSSPGCRACVAYNGRRHSLPYSVGASSTPSSASADTHTHLSTENLARELQAHMIDSLSDKEHHVRCVRNRFWRQKGYTGQMIAWESDGKPSPIIVLSADLQQTAFNPGNSSLQATPGALVNPRRRSFEPTALRSARLYATQSLLLPNSISTTTGLISSISEADTDLSEFLDDVPQDLSTVPLSVNSGWNGDNEPQSCSGVELVCHRSSPNSPKAVCDLNENGETSALGDVPTSMALPLTTNATEFGDSNSHRKSNFTVHAL